MQLTTIHYKNESNQRFVPTLIDSSAGHQRMTTLLAFCSSWLWCVGSSQMTYISQMFSLTSAFFHQRRKKAEMSPNCYHCTSTTSAWLSLLQKTLLVPVTWKQNCHSQLKRRHDRALPDDQPKSVHYTDIWILNNLIMCTHYLATKIPTSILTFN